MNIEIEDELTVRLHNIFWMLRMAGLVNPTVAGMFMKKSEYNYIGVFNSKWIYYNCLGRNLHD